MTTWPYAYPIAAVAGVFVQFSAFMFFGGWGILAAPLTLVVMVALIVLLDDRLASRA